ncbi:gfo/Idh/MocA family oxidoreductase [bacterium 1XD42-1]|nr:gfo/Idh/MocA family oxidoreductase [bacterium 1XD42-8]RKJ62905.1 gfo/Idh/MocA family oxidoreductase [bacterium 1XD42-1]
MRIGILGTADIAFRRFLPALQKCSDITYAGIASRTPEKTVSFTQVYGGKAYSSYETLLADESIDAVYVPLPPALHYEWGEKALKSGKHLLMEKPFTTSLAETKKLLSLAKKKKLTVHENYMFLYHNQLEKIKELVANGTLGELRLIRAAFGFPKRSEDDFRYKKALGGGALLDCGGYPVRLALELLGETTKVIQAKLQQPEGYEVDLFGSAVLENEKGLCAQISFGMDNVYKCELEIWGNKSCIFTDRIFTAPPDFYPSIIFHTKDTVHNERQNLDDAFANSICNFIKRSLLSNGQGRNVQIEKQAELIEELKEISR